LVHRARAAAVAADLANKVFGRAKLKPT
jgi:hypothetical protein